MSNIISELVSKSVIFYFQLIAARASLIILGFAINIQSFLRLDAGSTDVQVVGERISYTVLTGSEIAINSALPTPLGFSFDRLFYIDSWSILLFFFSFALVIIWYIIKAYYDSNNGYY
jgi:hypothetical protein